MEDKSGFYKKVSETEWWYAQNSVHTKEYTLNRDGNRESVDGWEWHDTAPQEYLEWIEKKQTI